MHRTRVQRFAMGDRGAEWNLLSVLDHSRSKTGDPECALAESTGSSVPTPIQQRHAYTANYITAAAATAALSRDLPGALRRHVIFDCVAIPHNRVRHCDGEQFAESKLDLGRAVVVHSVM